MKKIYVPDIECDSCVRLITKKLNKNNIKDFKVEKDSVLLDNKENEAIKIIKQAGYRASFEPFERKTFRERIRHYKENKTAYKIESLGFKNTLFVFISLLLFSVAAYFFIFNKIDNFFSSYAWWVFYLLISITSISMAAWHYFAYQGKVTCMTGMMIGMTFGMQTGMMIGAIIGATNGFFWGSMTGMLLGTGIGLLTGRCCGVMGLMEGAMAGVMGGTMGPMITVMMYSDNVLWFMPFYMIINVGIMLGLSYMLYEEVVEDKKVKIKPLDTVSLIALSVIAMSLLTALIIYGPSSSLIAY